MRRYVAPGAFTLAIGASLSTGVLAVLDAPDYLWRGTLALALAALGAGAWLVYRLAQRALRDVACGRAELKRARKAAVTSARGISSEIAALGRTTSSGLARVRKGTEQLDLQVRDVVWLVRDLQDQLVADAEARAVAAEERAAAAELRPSWLEIGRSTGAESA